MIDLKAVYRLYNVVPPLLTHIDNITNWYIRFNRDRLKGSGGLRDTLLSLNTLFDVLFTIVRALAPFAPFITDSIYHLLLPYIPSNIAADDPRCVHFLSFPEPQERYINEVIERRVSRMQTIIELGRVSRERRGINLKTPLKSLVVIHADPVYLEDIRSLEEYIAREINIHHIITSFDEVKYNVQYTVAADWPVLGKKLKKEAKRVRDLLPTLTSNQIRQMVQDRSIEVAGVKLDSSDLIVRRVLKDTRETTLETNTDGDVLLILDIEISQSLQLEGLTREVLNRIQRLRKKAGLLPTDDVRMEYKIVKDVDQVNIEEVFVANADVLSKTLRGPVQKYNDEGVFNSTNGCLILEEEQQVQHATFLLRLCRL